MTVLYVNHGISDHCGVHSFGVRHYEAIKGITSDQIVYVEINSAEEYFRACKEHQPWAVFFNYMPIVLPWVSSAITSYPCIRICVQHLYDANTIDSLVHQHGGLFQHYVVLDPTVHPSVPTIHAMGRPIPDPPASWKKKRLDTPVQVGTFGFALPHKQIPLIMREINKSFDSACFNLHMTEAHFAPGYMDSILQQVRSEITKPGITVNHTYNFLRDEEVVEMLSNNHVNALFYDLPPQMVGRSSSLDYMIAAKRPILTTHCDSFAVSNASQITALRYPDMTFSDIFSSIYDQLQDEAERLYEMCASSLTDETEEFLRSIR